MNAYIYLQIHSTEHPGPEANKENSNLISLYTYKTLTMLAVIPGLSNRNKLSVEAVEVAFPGWQILLEVAAMSCSFLNDFGQSCSNPFEGLEYWCGHGSKYLPFYVSSLRGKPSHTSLSSASVRPCHDHIIITPWLFILHYPDSQLACVIVISLKDAIQGDLATLFWWNGKIRRHDMNCLLANSIYKERRSVVASLLSQVADTRLSLITQRPLLTTLT